LDFFVYRGAFDGHLLGQPEADRRAMLRATLAQPSLTGLPLLLMGGDPPQVDIARRAHARGVTDPSVLFLLGIAALAEHDLPGALRHLDAALAEDPRFETALPYRDLARELMISR
jgi:hypothetical protein